MPFGSGKGMVQNRQKIHTQNFNLSFNASTRIPSQSHIDLAGWVERIQIASSECVLQWLFKVRDKSALQNNMSQRGLYI